MFAFMFVFLWCCTRVESSDTEVRICSDYLVSGVHGVNDVSLSASTVWEEPLFSFGPENARLYYPGDSTASPKARSVGWAAGVLNTNQYIQVAFPVKTNVTSVTLQGRHNFDLQYVKSYYLLYSMDGVTWSTVTSSDGSLKLFTGSADRDTPVTSYVTPSITALHIRINPQSWRGHIFMRFDVGGCQNQTRNLERSYPGLFQEDKSPPKMGNGRSYLDIKPKKELVEEYVFDMYGYKVEQDINMLYNVNEVKATKMDASATCTSQGTQLIIIDTRTKMSKLGTYINGVRVLQPNYGMYVSGTYRSGGLWLYESTGTAINNALWSPNNPDSSKGLCVMLTETGLASVNCGQKLLSICGF